MRMRAAAVLRRETHDSRQRSDACTSDPSASCIPTMVQLQCCVAHTAYMTPAAELLPSSPHVVSIQAKTVAAHPPSPTPPPGLTRLGLPLTVLNSRSSSGYTTRWASLDMVPLASSYLMHRHRRHMQRKHQGKSTMREG